ncbi:hypothetical protein NW768_004053 [Fusarium equiseti]|uniref:Uncharacterized protein n=1 Tax=Fusarium equiseti TaxID=61235 RepID=A0ABQ8RJI9_FUSEQ|nr:hypothetical protein NW768_004053 [Fusarium equiseti]
MDGHDSQEPSSQTVRVDGATQSQRLEIGAGGIKKRGRPRGSKNKPKDTDPQTEGLQLRNRAVSVPQYELDAGDDDAQDDQAVQESGSEYDDYASEARSIDLHKKAFREGVQRMARLINDLGPVTRQNFESQHPLSPSGSGGVTGILNPTSEEDLDRAWECSVEKAAILHYPSRANTFLSLWRLSLRLFGVDPLTLVSLYQNVEFNNRASDPFEHLGEMKQNPLWTIDFCRRLELIMVHPLFSDGNAFRFIPIIIRWAVICRVDDGHGFTDKQHRLLEDFHCGDLRSSNGIGAVVERFLDHQNKRKDHGLIITRQAKLMSRVADLARTVEGDPESNITPVKTRDLSLIIKALDTLENGTITTSCETYHLVFSVCKEPRGYPMGMGELLEAYKISWMNLQRRKTFDQIREETNITMERPVEGSLTANGPGERTIGWDQEGASTMADHAIVSERGRNGRVSETSSNSAQGVIHHRRRSASILEDGEVHESSGPPISSPTGNEYIHGSRKSLIADRQGSEPLVTSDADDEHLHESRRSLIESNRGSANLSQSIPRDLPMNDNKVFLSQGTIQNGSSTGATMSSFGRNTERASVEARGLANPITVKREPDRDLGEDDEFKFLEIDRFISGDDGTGRSSHRTAGTSASSNRASEPAMWPNRTRKRPSRGHREQKSAKRQNTHGTQQSQQSGGRDKNTNRRKNGVGHQGGFQPPPAQPPNGPRAWRLEQRYKGK